MRTPSAGRSVLNAELLEGREVPAGLLMGGIVSGAVPAGGGADARTFTGNPGDRIELYTTSTPTQAGFTAYTEVFAPSGNRVAAFWPNNNVVLVLGESGTYTAQVRDSDNREAGQYTIGYEGLNPISPDPAPLVMGGITTGGITAPSDKDQLTFSGKAGDRIELITTSTARQAGFTAYTEVFGPSGNRVAAFWPNNNVVLDLEETGVHMVQVRDDNYTEAGDYAIGYEGLNPISPAPDRLALGAIVGKSIDGRTEKDQWTFAGEAGDRIELITTSTAKTAGFTAYTEVFGPSGTRIAGFWPNNNVTLDLPESGTYMIQVRDDNYTETGAYTIGFESLNPLSPDAKALAPATTVSGTIGKATKKDQWVIAVPEGKRLKVVLGETPISTGFKAYANIYDAAGNRVAGMWAGKQTFTLGPGRYTIQVVDAGLAKKGMYTLKAKAVV